MLHYKWKFFNQTEKNWEFQHLQCISYQTEFLHIFKNKCCQSKLDSGFYLFFLCQRHLFCRLSRELVNVIAALLHSLAINFHSVINLRMRKQASYAFLRMVLFGTRVFFLLPNRSTTMHLPSKSLEPVYLWVGVLHFQHFIKFKELTLRFAHICHKIKTGPSVTFWNGNALIRILTAIKCELIIEQF